MKYSSSKSSGQAIDVQELSFFKELSRSAVVLQSFFRGFYCRIQLRRAIEESNNFLKNCTSLQLNEEKCESLKLYRKYIIVDYKGQQIEESWTKYSGLFDVDIVYSCGTRNNLNHNDNQAADSYNSCISLFIVKNIRWLPFCLIPDDEFVKLFPCDIFSITSSTIRNQDYIRVYRIITENKYLEDHWSGIKSLIIHQSQGIYSENISSGLIKLFSLRISNLIDISLSNAHLNKIITLKLAEKLMVSTKIKKISLQNDIIFDDECLDILLKYLQRNASVENLIVTNCGLTSKSVNSLIRYIPVSSSIRLINLRQNTFNVHDIMSISRALLSKPRGHTIQRIILSSQSPPLSESNILELMSWTKQNKFNILIESNQIFKNLYAVEDNEDDYNSWKLPVIEV